MAEDQKDRLAEKLQRKERAEEDRYFAERDRQLLARLKGAGEAAAGLHGDELRCPSCGQGLDGEAVLGILVSACASCKGIWLDLTALEQAATGDEGRLLSLCLTRLRKRTG